MLLYFDNGRKLEDQLLGHFLKIIGGFKSQVAKYKEVFLTVTAEANKIDGALAARFDERPSEYTPNTSPSNNMPPGENLNLLPLNLDLYYKGFVSLVNRLT